MSVTEEAYLPSEEELRRIREFDGHLSPNGRERYNRYTRYPVWELQPELGAIAEEEYRLHWAPWGYGPEVFLAWRYIDLEDTKYNPDPYRLSTPAPGTSNSQQLLSAFAHVRSSSEYSWMEFRELHGPWIVGVEFANDWWEFAQKPRRLSSQRERAQYAMSWARWGLDAATATAFRNRLRVQEGHFAWGWRNVHTELLLLVRQLNARHVGDNAQRQSMIASAEDWSTEYRQGMCGRLTAAAMIYCEMPGPRQRPVRDRPRHYHVSAGELRRERERARDLGDHSRRATQHVERLGGDLKTVARTAEMTYRDWTVRDWTHPGGERAYWDGIEAAQHLATLTPEQLPLVADLHRWWLGPVDDMARTITFSSALEYVTHGVPPEWAAAAEGS